MVSVRYVARSLLLGYSCLWLIIQSMTPGIWWPALSTTKTRYCLLYVPYFREILSGKRQLWIKRRLGTYASFLIKLMTWLGIVVYMSYLIALVWLSFETQKDVLESYGIIREQKLSYKTLYYTPLLNRISIVIFEALSVILWKHKEWLTFDKYAIFSLSETTQFKFALITLMVSMPDSYFDHLEVKTYLAFDKSDRYTLIGLLHYTNSIYLDKPILYRLMGMMLRTMSFMNKVVRYRSILTVVFSSLCVRRHLKVINNQIIMNHRKVEPKPEAGHPGDYGGPPGHRQLDTAQAWPNSNTSTSGIISSSDHHQESLATVSHPNAHVGEEKKWLDSHVLGDADYKSPDRFWMSHKVAGASGGDRHPTTGSRGSNAGEAKFRMSHQFNSFYSDSHSNYSSQASSKNARQPIESGATTTTTVGEMFEIGTKIDHHNQANICIIRNLRQLELHLTKLEFFVNDIDRSAATLVYFICLIYLTQFIYSIFFLLELQSSYTDLLLGMVFCLSRLLTPFVLFLAGNGMEQEARHLLAELECIYLQDSTQCLIYKQYSSTICSLSRIVKQLKSIKFDCDNLMSINLDTMKRLILYAIAIIFFVVQYDALNVLYDRSEVALNSSSGSIFPTPTPATTTTTTALGSPATQLTRATTT